MPNVNPTPKDVVQIKIRGTKGFENEHYITAEILDGEGGRFRVMVAGEPELTGVIDITNYQWDHKQGRWLPKSAGTPKPPLPKVIPLDDDLSIPRAAGISGKNISDAGR